MKDQIQLRRPERQKKTSGEPPVFSDEGIRRQLAEAAGTEMFRHRDISYHLTETFCQTFDRVGRQKAAKALSGSGTEVGNEGPGLEEKNGLKVLPGSGLRETVPGLEHQPGADPPQGRAEMGDSYQTRPGQEERLSRFADLAFQRGRLSAAILQGTGKMMLFSCLERTAGQEHGLHARERMLFQTSSSHRNIPHGKGGRAIVNKGFARSAVGLVVDTLQDSRQSMLDLMALAEGGGPGSETLCREYPFLSDTKERELLAVYRSRLEELKDPGCEEERQILLAAEEKVQSQLQKKEQMKENFLQKLRQLSDQALQAQLLFSQTGTQREAAQVLEEAETDPEGEDEPPETPAGEDGNGGTEGRADPGAKT